MLSDQMKSRFPTWAQFGKFGIRKFLVTQYQQVKLSVLPTDKRHHFATLAIETFKLNYQSYHTFNNNYDSHIT